jgi:SWI/SNF-related matrix-associated actin-dependent regulator of chromatin subfamily A3
MKTNPNRPCSACGAALKLPADVIEVVPPDSEQAIEIAEQAPKRAIRKKYVRPPGEKPDLSTKMTFLLNELMRFSCRNPNSANYNPAALDEELDDGVEELDAEGKPFIVKSIVLSVGVVLSFEPAS